MRSRRHQCSSPSFSSHDASLSCKPTLRINMWPQPLTAGPDCAHADWTRQQQQQHISNKPSSCCSVVHPPSAQIQICQRNGCLHDCNLCRDLEQMEAVPSRQRCMQRSELCRSLAGNSCPLITITNPLPDPHIRRPAVVFSGTAHVEAV